MIKSVLTNLELEKKQLRDHLENFKFDDFKTDLDKWLKTGRQVWYISGNLSEEDATLIVEEAKQTLNLEQIKISDLPDQRVTALEENTAFTIEQSLTDETNENSCILTYFEVGV